MVDAVAAEYATTRVPEALHEAPWMGADSFPVTAPPGAYGYRRWGKQRVCSAEKLKSLAAKWAIMGDRLVWTPESRYLRSTFEIEWLRVPALLRSRTFELRSFFISLLFVGLQLFVIRRDVVMPNQGAAVIASDLSALIFFAYWTLLSWKDYRESASPSDVVVSHRIARARFFSWVLYEPAPWLLSIASILLFIFSLQCLSDINSTEMFPPSARALAFSRPLTFQGEWWRMATGPLLHHHFPHLIGNLVGWFVLCRFLEPLSARWTIPLVATVGALAGGALSLFIFPRSASVGFSGALSGMTAFLLVLWLRRRDQLPSRSLIAWFLCVLSGMTSDWSNSARIDYAGHAGGFAAGLALAFMLVDAKTREIPIRARPWATRLGQICAALLIIDAAYVIGKLLTIIDWQHLI